MLFSCEVASIQRRMCAFVPTSVTLYTQNWGSIHYATDARVRLDQFAKERGIKNLEAWYNIKFSDITASFPNGMLFIEYLLCSASTQLALKFFSYRCETTAPWASLWAVQCRLCCLPQSRVACLEVCAIPKALVEIYFEPENIFAVSCKSERDHLYGWLVHNK